MTPSRQASFPDTRRPAVVPLAALADEEPLEPVLVLSLDDIAPDIPPLPPPPPPIRDALPVLPPLPEVVLDPLPAREPWTFWGLVRGFFGGIYSAVEWVFGAATLIVG